MTQCVSRGHVQLDEHVHVGARIWPSVVDFDQRRRALALPDPFDTLRLSRTGSGGLSLHRFRQGSKEGAPDEVGLGLDRGLVDEHDGDVVFYPIHAMAVGALQSFRILTIFERMFALRTNEHIEKVF